MHILLVHSFLLAISIAHASVAFYGHHVQQPFGRVEAASPSFTSTIGYDDVKLVPPPRSNPSTSIGVQLETGTVRGLSVPQQGSFFGFSIELGIATQILGPNSSSLYARFLNLMANIRERAGGIHIHVGSSAQKYATVVESTPDGSALESISPHPTDTPTLGFTPEIIKTMAEISSLTNVHWYLGASNATQDSYLQLAEVAGSILGDYMVGLQAGNAPDLYSRHGHRSSTYGPNEYKNEFAQLIQAINANSNMSAKGLLIGPNLAGVWKLEDVWDTGFVTDFKQNLAALAVELYSTDDCSEQRGIGAPRTTQEMPSSLTHQSAQQVVSGYLGSIAYAQAERLPFVMLGTNVPSCGSLSDSFATTLWAIDHGLQMAYVNFTRAMFHIGSKHDHSNPFTSPVTEQSNSYEWTIGPVYYSSLFVAEALGPSNQSQVLDLQVNGGNEFTPGYAIYENGQPTRVALMNFMDDKSSTSGYTASISIDGRIPSQVRVKYLSASSVTHKYNITWAGQTFGMDGRPVGEIDVQTVDCDEDNNVCNVQVSAPGAALVFLSDQALVKSEQGPAMMFPTTDQTVDGATPATYNGSSGNGSNVGALARTSQDGAINGAFGFPNALPGVGILVAVTTFVCLESLLSYVVTGKSLLGAVTDMTKNAR